MGQTRVSTAGVQDNDPPSSPAWESPGGENGGLPFTILRPYCHYPMVADLPAREEINCRVSVLLSLSYNFRVRTRWSGTNMEWLRLNPRSNVPALPSCSAPLFLRQFGWGPGYWQAQVAPPGSAFCLPHSLPSILPTSDMVLFS